MRVQISPTALTQIAEIEEWWTEHRPKAPTLFTDELDAAIDRLARFPEVGARYEPMPGTRRVLLPRTGYHVYTIEDDVVVTIVAVWSAIRQGRPRR